MPFHSAILPITKAFSLSSSRYVSLDDEDWSQQYGRTSSSLSAEAASAAISREVSSDWDKRDQVSSRSTLPRKTSDRSQEGHVPIASATAPQLAPLPRQPSLAAGVPSILRPSLAERLSKSRSNSLSKYQSRRSKRQGARRTKSREALITDEDKLPPFPTPPQGRKRRPKPIKAIYPPCRLSPPRTPTQEPLTLHDLGQDYSRYPHCHPHGKRTSNTISTSALPTGGAVTAVTALSESTDKTLVASPMGKTIFKSSSSASSHEKHDEKPFFPYLDDRIGAPSLAEHGYNFPMYSSEKENDDEMHIPSAEDDVRLKPTLRDYLARGRLCSLIGMSFFFIGLLILFIVFPVMFYVQFDHQYNTPLQNTNITGIGDQFKWDWINGKNYSLFSNVRTSLIDPTTPDHAKTRPAMDGSTLELVYSDEFNDAGRTFYPGDDPYWTAPDMWYGSTQDLEWYDPDAVTTSDGTLLLQLEKFRNHGLDFRSGMLNSWNQICFKGGALEISISLAGPAGVQGLWPGAWTMGNLGRPGYRASTDGTWPYTYNSCDAGITPNQSSTDGLSVLPGQKLASCTCPGEDHPTPGKGRGAPEIDVLEGSANGASKMGIVTQSLQVAPFDIWWRPNYDFMAIADDNITSMNTYCGGPSQQAISGVTTVNKDWYDGLEYQKYAFEYTPGQGGDGNIGWFVGNEPTISMTGDAIGPNGNVGARLISEEPMSVVLNLGISNSWTQIDWDHLKFPAAMRVDYVRWYQRKGEGSVTCDPVGWETTGYIERHPKAYENMNLTVCCFLCFSCGLGGWWHWLMW